MFSNSNTAFQVHDSEKLYLSANLLTFYNSIRKVFEAFIFVDETTEPQNLNNFAKVIYFSTIIVIVDLMLSVFILDELIVTVLSLFIISFNPQALKYIIIISQK